VSVSSRHGEYFIYFGVFMSTNPDLAFDMAEEMFVDAVDEPPAPGTFERVGELGGAVMLDLIKLYIVKHRLAELLDSFQIEVASRSTVRSFVSSLLPFRRASTNSNPITRETVQAELHSILRVSFAQYLDQPVAGEEKRDSAIGALLKRINALKDSLHACTSVDESLLTAINTYEGTLRVLAHSTLELHAAWHQSYQPKKQDNSISRPSMKRVSRDPLLLWEERGYSDIWDFLNVNFRKSVNVVPAPAFKKCFAEQAGSLLKAEENLVLVEGAGRSLNDIVVELFAF